jgi:hypothetical protein
MQKEARRRIPKLPTVFRTIVLLLYVCQRFFSFDHFILKAYYALT